MSTFVTPLQALARTPLENVEYVSVIPEKLKFKHTYSESWYPENYLGRMNRQCAYCTARYYENEMTARREYNLCCQGGDIRLPLTSSRTFEPALMDLLISNDTRSIQFRNHILHYNSELSFTSLGIVIILCSNKFIIL
jgi:hypothetical protein